MTESGALLIEAAVFDYGGVLTTPVRDSIAAWLAADGIDPDSFSTTLKGWLSRRAPDRTPIHRLETGQLRVEEFEEVLAQRLTTLDGKPVVAAGLLQRLFAGTRTEQAMLDLVRELRGLGVRTALLSNSWGNTYPRKMLTELFDVVVISGEVGLRKPDPRIYDLTLDRLGVPATGAVFIDDAAPNVEAADRLGMRALLHEQPATTRERLTRLIPQLAA
jgi:putative hydrolase of the HAD superfamily